MSRRSVYFDPPELWDQVGQVAKAQDRSHSYVVCRLLEAALAVSDAQPQPKVPEPARDRQAPTRLAGDVMDTAEEGPTAVFHVLLATLPEGDRPSWEARWQAAQDAERRYRDRMRAWDESLMTITRGGQ